MGVVVIIVTFSSLVFFTLSPPESPLQSSTYSSVEKSLCPLFPLNLLHVLFLSPFLKLSPFFTSHCCSLLFYPVSFLPIVFCMLYSPHLISSYSHLLSSIGISLIIDAICPSTPIIISFLSLSHLFLSPHSISLISHRAHSSIFFSDLNLFSVFLLFTSLLLFPYRLLFCHFFFLLSLCLFLLPTVICLDCGFRFSVPTR